MPLPKSVRRLVPDRVRDDRRLRAIALGAGLIPPRTMHSPGEAATLARLAAPARCVVELGVYEGSSAVVLCHALGAGAELHLVDPFVDSSGASLRAGAGASRWATRIAVARAARGGSVQLVWHVARSQDAGRAWTGGPVDFVFIDGDHSREGCREDFEVWAPHVSSAGTVAFHDAREGAADGRGAIGPTSVVDELFRAGTSEWRIVEELDSLVVVRRLL
jgi:predicted O-methyltransferase YrrM